MHGQNGCWLNLKEMMQKHCTIIMKLNDKKLTLDRVCNTRVSQSRQNQ